MKIHAARPTPAHRARQAPRPRFDAMTTPLMSDAQVDALMDGLHLDADSAGWPDAGAVEALAPRQPRHD